MNQLMIMTHTQTMTSKELVDVINAIRKEEGNTTEIDHSDLMRRIRGFEQILHARSITGDEYLGRNGQLRPMLQLSKEACLLTVSSESPRINLAIIRRWQELETQRRPLTQLEAYEALVEGEKQRLKLLDTVGAQAKVIVYKKIITGEGEDYFPVSAITDLTGISYSGRKLNKLSHEMEIPSISMFASKGQIQIKAYHWSVWETAYPDVIFPV